MTEKTEIEFRVYDSFTDYRDEICPICKKKCNPHVRHCYTIEAHGEQLVDDEFITCEICVKI